MTRNTPSKPAPKMKQPTKKKAERTPTRPKRAAKKGKPKKAEPRLAGVFWDDIRSIVREELATRAAAESSSPSTPKGAERGE